MTLANDLIDRRGSGVHPRPAAPSARSDSGVTLRLIRDEEMAVVGLLARRAYEVDYPGQPAEYLAEIEAVAARALVSQVWVAVDDLSGELCGTVTLPAPGHVLSPVAQEGECDVRLLAVAHSARGRGIGGLLMRHAIDTARERGAARLVLNTTNEMAGARKLYDRMGFVELSERAQQLTRANGTRFTLLVYGYDL